MRREKKSRTARHFSRCRPATLSHREWRERGPTGVYTHTHAHTHKRERLLVPQLGLGLGSHNLPSPSMRYDGPIQKTERPTDRRSAAPERALLLCLDFFFFSFFRFFRFSSFPLPFFPTNPSPFFSSPSSLSSFLPSSIFFSFLSFVKLFSPSLGLFLKLLRPPPTTLDWPVHFFTCSNHLRPNIS